MPHSKPVKIIACISITLVILRIIMFMLSLHFYSGIVDHILFGIILLLISLMIQFSISSKSGKVTNAIRMGILLSLYFLFILFMNAFGTSSGVRTLHFKNLDKTVMMYFHQAMWGGTPYQHVMIGNSYLNGFIYSIEAEKDFYAEFDPALFPEYKIPAAIDQSSMVIVWEEQGLLLDFTDYVSYPAEKK